MASYRCSNCDNSEFSEGFQTIMLGKKPNRKEHLQCKSCWLAVPVKEELGD